MHLKCNSLSTFVWMGCNVLLLHSHTMSVNLAVFFFKKKRREKTKRNVCLNFHYFLFTFVTFIKCYSLRQFMVCFLLPSSTLDSL